jgi:hypothetical protein
LTAAELAPVAQEAVARWAAAGLDAAGLGKLNAVEYQIVALGGGVLGLASVGGQVVSLDATAAGYGWFVDPISPDDTEFGTRIAAGEFQASPGSQAFGRMDLLTVVEHELGHVLGLGDLDPQAVPHDLMTLTLATGVRRAPTPADMAALGIAGATTTTPNHQVPVPMDLTTEPPVVTPAVSGAAGDGVAQHPATPNSDTAVGVFDRNLDPSLLLASQFLVSNAVPAGAVTASQATGTNSVPAQFPNPIGPVDSAFSASSLASTPVAAGGGDGSGGHTSSVDIGALDQVFGSAKLGGDL